MYTYQEVRDAIDYIQLALVRHKITMYDVDITGSQRTGESYIILHQPGKDLWIHNNPLNITWSDGTAFTRPYHSISHTNNIRYDPRVNYLMELYYQIQCCEPIRGSKK